MGLTSSSWSITTVNGEVVEVRNKMIVLGVEWALWINNRCCDRLKKRGFQFGHLTLRGTLSDGTPIRVIANAFSGNPIVSVGGNEFQMRQEY